MQHYDTTAWQLGKQQWIPCVYNSQSLSTTILTHFCLLLAITFTVYYDYMQNRCQAWLDMKTNDYKHLYSIHFNNSLIITLHCNTQGCCQEHPGTITMLWEEWCYGKNGDGRQDHARPLRVLISVLISGAPKEMGETKQAGDHPTHGPRLVNGSLPIQLWA